MTIQEFNTSVIKNNLTRRLQTNYNSDNSFKVFLDPNLMPLFPLEEKSIALNETCNVLSTVQQQYQKFTDLITRKILQNKVNFKFYNFTQKPQFINRNLQEVYIGVLNSHYINFVNFIANRKRITNIETFYQEFLLYTEQYCSILPFTLYTTNLKHKRYFENTGLVILLQQDKLDNERKIITDFLNRFDNTNDYIRIANLTGFEVDAAIPYRMIFNPYRGINKQEINNFYKNNFYDYYALEMSYLDTAMETMYRQYTTDKTSVAIPQEQCEKIIKTAKKNINTDSFVSKDKKIKLYITALFAENGITNTKAKNDAINNAIIVNETLDFRSAMEYAVGQMRKLKTTRTFT